MRTLLFAAAILLGAASLSRIVTTQQVDLDSRITKLAGAISEERLGAALKKLESFGTRSIFSATDSPTRGIGAARQWIFDEMKSYSAKLAVSFDSYKVARQDGAGQTAPRIARDVEIRNVIAVLPGTSPRRVYISSHYDTTAISRGQAGERLEPGSGLPNDSPAPGVNDDGSGTALTVELARVFSETGIEFDATLVFACWAGEEQGVIGSSLHAQRAAAEHTVIDAVFDSDIVGNERGGNGVIDGSSIRLYSDGPEDSASRALARYIQRVAARYEPSHRVRLMARQDRFGRGGDNRAFNWYGFAAVVFRESRENFARQHDPRDTFEGTSPAYLVRNARVNAAAAASLALAPPAPVVTNERGQPTLGRQPSGYDANLKWAPSPGAAAYRIFWREAWGPDWQHDVLVGNVTELMLPNMQIDDYVFGVAAVGPGGHESVISSYVWPPVPKRTVTTIP